MGIASNMTYALEYAFLGAWTGAISLAIGTVRNITYFIFDKKGLKPNKIVLMIFIFLLVGAGIYTWENVTSLLPMVALILWTVASWQDNTKWMREKCEVVVKGNADNHAVNPIREHMEWHKEKLGKERIEYLDNLPMYKDVWISGSHIRMFHATKNDFNYRIFDIDSIEKKKIMFQDENGKEPDIVLYGDIHKQYMQKLQNKTIINVGSVGNAVESPNYDETITNMEETTQSYYCILEGEYGSKQRSSIGIQFIRVPYDIEKEIELAKKNGAPSIDSYIMELTTAKYRLLKK